MADEKITLKIGHTLIIDNAITAQECDDLIGEFNKNLKTELIDTHNHYEYKDIFYEHNILSSLVKHSLQEYKKKFPIIDQTSYRWQLQQWRFKRFPPGYFYDSWHSEHTRISPHRILACLLYLSDHNCGTEFKETSETVLSKKGRILMFPTFWTHIHRGQLCPDNKERFIMTAYAEFA
jgi:hypothetical protein